MKFVINRASMYVDEQPCPEAYPEALIRTFKYRGKIITDKVNRWVIEIDTMEDLQKITDDNSKKFVIDFNKYSDDDIYPSIIIYDDWIE